MTGKNLARLQCVMLSAIATASHGGAQLLRGVGKDAGEGQIVRPGAILWPRCGIGGPVIVRYGQGVSESLGLLPRKPSGYHRLHKPVFLERASKWHYSNEEGNLPHHWRRPLSLRL